MPRLLLCLILFFSISCNFALKETYLTPEMMSELKSDVIEKLSKCDDFEAYIPDSSLIELYPKRIIRINLHFMNSRYGKYNYAEEEAKEYGKLLVYYANRKLAHNKKMNLPEGNDTPVLHPHYQYQITPSGPEDKDRGIYTHYDESLYYYVNEGARNNYNRDVVKKYAIGEDSILNIFYMPHHPDSIASKSYSGSAAGIALGKSLKLGVQYNPEDKAWYYASLLNHEIGHVLGLHHTWNMRDGCDDTPRNPNCWAPTDKPPCDGAVSNNMMDYNSNQNAITPCQIGRMQKNMSRVGSKQRDLLVRDWCRVDTVYDLSIDRRVHLLGAYDVRGNIHVYEGGQLTISCRLSMPEGSEILVHPGGKLILDNANIHNECGLKWKGIKVLRKGKISGSVLFSGIPIIKDLEHSFSFPELDLND